MAAARAAMWRAGSGTLVGGAPRRAVLAVALVCAASGAHAAAVIVDDRGRGIALPQDRPLRIVSLAPHATEWLVAMGALPRLIAVDPNSDEPATVRALPRVTAWPAPDREALAALRADVVVVWGAGLRPEGLARLEALGPAIYVSEPRGLADLPQAAARLAALAPDPARAQAVVRAWSQAMAALADRYRGAATVPVFPQVSTRPLITLSERDPAGEALRVCGARSVYAQAAAAAPAVGVEAVLARAPAAVMLIDPVADPEPWRGLGLLAPAGPLAVLRAEAALVRPGPRLPEALGRLCEAIDALRRARPGAAGR